MVLFFFNEGRIVYTLPNDEHVDCRGNCQKTCQKKTISGIFYMSEYEELVVWHP